MVDSATKINLERIRYTSYQPQAIESMTLTCDKTLLALGRENKSIEIWRVPQSWSQLIVIPGNQNCDIRDLHWVEPNAYSEPVKDSTFLLYYQTSELKSRMRKRRLVSSGLNGSVIEWDLTTLKPKSKYTSNTAIWQS